MTSGVSEVIPGLSKPACATLTGLLAALRTRGVSPSMSETLVPPNQSLWRIRSIRSGAGVSPASLEQLSPPWENGIAVLTVSDGVGGALVNHAPPAPACDMGNGRVSLMCPWVTGSNWK